jgi:hypothetical protein
LGNDVIESKRWGESGKLRAQLTAYVQKLLMWPGEKTFILFMIGNRTAGGEKACNESAYKDSHL